MGDFHKALIILAMIFIISVWLFSLSGCVNHPSYWSEESCEYCIKQNEHYIRIHKDELIKAKINRLENRINSFYVEYQENKEKSEKRNK